MSRLCRCLLSPRSAYPWLSEVWHARARLCQSSSVLGLALLSLCATLRGSSLSLSGGMKSGSSLCCDRHVDSGIVTVSEVVCTSGCFSGGAQRRIWAVPCHFEALRVQAAHFPCGNIPRLGSSLSQRSLRNLVPRCLSSVCQNLDPRCP